MGVRLRFYSRSFCCAKECRWLGDAGRLARKCMNQLNTDLDTTVRAVNSQEPLNAVKELKDKWDGLPIGVLLKTNVTTNFGNGPYVVVLYYKHELEEYGWALLLTYRFPRPVYVTLSAGTWREPVWV